MKWALLLIPIVAAGCISSVLTSTNSLSSPENAVRTYFESWNNKNWADMYSAISDGFKEGMDVAKNISAFSSFVGQQNVSVKIINITKEIINSTDVKVKFIVQYTFNNMTVNATSDFIVEKINGDWKITNPFGK
jgi:hypothetical protein